VALITGGDLADKSQDVGGTAARGLDTDLGHGTKGPLFPLMDGVSYNAVNGIRPRGFLVNR
jgi:hypothetical protein